jgi:hypothetical protein
MTKTSSRAIARSRLASLVRHNCHKQRHRSAHQEWIACAGDGGQVCGGQTLWMTSLYQLWRFENALDAGQVANGPKSHDAEAHCGLCVIDLRSGDLVHWLWLGEPG